GLAAQTLQPRAEIIVQRGLFRRGGRLVNHLRRLLGRRFGRSLLRRRGGDWLLDGRLLARWLSALWLLHRRLSVHRSPLISHRSNFLLPSSGCLPLAPLVCFNRPLATRCPATPGHPATRTGRRAADGGNGRPGNPGCTAPTPTPRHTAA